jgi:hypothetical protein
MKGTLHKAESGWQVWYQNREDLFYEGTVVKILPLHPDEPMLVDKRWENTEVEFEIVEVQQICNGYKNQPENVIGFVAAYEYVKYAKLIDDDLSDWDVTLTDGLEKIEWDTKPAQSPKDKAKELVDKFLKQSLWMYQAKGCALIAVDEIINTLNSDIRDLDVRGNILLDLIEYWREVKEEIEKL